MLEDIQIKLDILNDSIKALITLTGNRSHPIDMPGLEVDAILRLYNNYLEEILRDIDELRKKERGVTK